MALEQQIVKAGVRRIAPSVTKRIIPGGLLGMLALAAAGVVAKVAYDSHQKNQEYYDKHVRPLKEETSRITTVIGNLGDSSRNDYQYGGAYGELSWYEQTVYPNSRDFTSAGPDMYYEVPPAKGDNKYRHSPQPGDAVGLIDAAIKTFEAGSYKPKGRIAGQLTDLIERISQPHPNLEFNEEREDIRALVDELKRIRSDYEYKATRMWDARPGF